MKTIVNLDETPGKMVGKMPQGSVAERSERLAARVQSLQPKLPFPKGVFRFKTFEEADAWETKHRIEATVTRLRAPQR